MRTELLTKICYGLRGILAVVDPTQLLLDFLFDKMSIVISKNEHMSRDKGSDANSGQIRELESELVKHSSHEPPQSPAPAWRLSKTSAYIFFSFLNQLLSPFTFSIDVHWSDEILLLSSWVHILASFLFSLCWHRHSKFPSIDVFLGRTYVVL